MLRINPPTALLLLSDIVALKPGDWIIQNVANSAVGRLVIRLARARGVRTMNVVRRESLFAELRALGADACVVDGPELAETVKAQTGGAPIRLGLDAVSGRATARLSSCVGEGGVVCNYGSMSGEDPVMARSALTGSGQTLVGFILGRGLATRTLGAGPGDLRRPRRAGPQGRLVGAGREGLPDRGDQGCAGPRAAGRAQRQDPGGSERVGGSAMTAQGLSKIAGGIAVVAVVVVTGMATWSLLRPSDPDSIQVSEAPQPREAPRLGDMTGYVGRVDPDTQMIVVSASPVGANPVMLVVNSAASITVRGKPSGLRDLSKDMPVRVVYEVRDDVKYATSIQVVTEEAQAPRGSETKPAVETKPPVEARPPVEAKPAPPVVSPASPATRPPATVPPVTAAPPRPTPPAPEPVKPPVEAKAGAASGVAGSTSDTAAGHGAARHRDVAPTDPAAAGASQAPRAGTAAACAASLGPSPRRDGRRRRQRGD